MFTGIVEELGSVRHVLPGSRAGKIVIGASKVLEGTQIGDSIAVNGVCLTVVAMGEDEFTADVMPETLRKSSLGQLKTGDPVDLERAMAADGRFGGHIVSGHIDGVGRIKDVRPEQNARVVTIEAPASVLALIVEKGSIAIDGISLTVASVGATTFSVSIIPHTGEQTVLLRKRAGDMVNLENDIVGKYVQKLLAGGAADDAPVAGAGQARGGLTLEYLQENGF
jgi:riboflavin synthase